VSTTAETLLEQLRKLPPDDQREVSRQLSKFLTVTPGPPPPAFPTVKVGGGTITSGQVAEALEDE